MSLLAACVLLISGEKTAVANPHQIQQLVFESKYYTAGLSSAAPRFTFFGVDGLGKSSFGPNPVLPESDPKEGGLRLERDGPNSYAYTYTRSGGANVAIWRVKKDGKSITLESDFVPDMNVPAFALDFRQKACHATLLGWMVAGKRQVKLPSVLHIPDHGSMRITGSAGAALDYDARRYVQPEPYVKIAFPAATKAHPRVTYRLEVAAIYPPLTGLTDDSIYDGFKRGFLNIFQLNPRLGMLANNASSDIVPFTLFEYAEVARAAPPLAKGLTCMDLVRATLDQYLAGMKGYGQTGYGPGTTGADIVGWGSPYDSLDTYPSLLIAAAEYIRTTHDDAWGKANFPKLAEWADKIMAGDKDGNGLIEYGRTGNLGDRSTPNGRPANWWDCINFGHEDAYSNALAYRALDLFSGVAKRLGHLKETAVYRAFSDKLKAAYLSAFLNSETGLLAGWRSKDGKLHDYAFTFVQGVAITYGLIPDKPANAIMDHLMAKMKSVRFTRFDLGLPGNLIAVPKADYVQHGWANAIGVGEPNLEDGSDAFQIYENGGATGCYAYFTIKALYKLGRVDEARMIFLPMLKGYSDGNFMGFGPNGQSKDWRAWDGACHGYEGLLVDSFLTLLCVEDELKAKP